MVISQWLGFPKTDETHYLTGTSANEASAIFRNVANTILPYTEGTSFSGQKNAYAENGISPVDTYGTGQTTTTSENKDFLKDVQERAQNLVDDAKKAIDESGITEKAKNLWDTITGWFH